MNDQNDKLWPMLHKLGVVMKSEEKELVVYNVSLKHPKEPKSSQKNPKTGFKYPFGG